MRVAAGSVAVAVVTDEQRCTDEVGTPDDEPAGTTHHLAVVQRLWLDQAGGLLLVAPVDQPVKGVADELVVVTIQAVAKVVDVSPSMPCHSSIVADTGRAGDAGQAFVEWPGKSFASGSMSMAALLTAVAASPKPTEISLTFPSYSVMSPAAKIRGRLVAIRVST